MLKTILCFIFFLCSLDSNAINYLFNNRKTNYDIVLNSTATTSEKTAANELQLYLKEISGTILPIRTNSQKSTKHIYIGLDKAIAIKAKTQIPLADYEGFTYKTIGNDLYIYGGSNRGTMYGVYSFLEQQLDVRWYTKECTVVPHKKTWALRDLNHSEKPVFKYRYDQFFEKATANPAWAAHNHMNMVWEAPKNEYGNFEQYWGAHTSFLLVPPSNYFSAHPEYYSLRNGKRISNGQLCLSNPQVKKIAESKLREYIKSFPGYWCYDISQNDNELYCECKNCKVLEKRYGGHSGIWIWFVNQIARDLKKNIPEKKIGTFAYRYTRHAPEHIKPEDNVVIRLCSIECCFAHPLENGCDTNKKFLLDLQNWSKITNNLFIWDYAANASEYLIPWPNLKVIGPNIRTFAKYGAIAVLEEGQYLHPNCGDLSELKAWVLSKLLWNPNLNEDSLICDFVKGFYKQSYKYVESYIELSINQITPKTYIGLNTNCGNPIYSKEYINNALNLINQAEKCTNNEKEKQRLDRILITLLYTQYYIDWGSSINSMNNKRLIELLKRDQPMVNEATTAEEYIKGRNDI